MKRLMLTATALVIALGLGACDRFRTADRDRTVTTPSSSAPSSTTSGAAGTSGPAGTAGPAGSAATTTERESGRLGSSTSTDTSSDAMKRERDRK